MEEVSTDASSSFPFLSLPVELQLLCLRTLPISQVVLVCARTCKHFTALARLLWREFVRVSRPSEARHLLLLGGTVGPEATPSPQVSAWPHARVRAGVLALSHTATAHTLQFSELAPMPTPRAGFACVHVPGVGVYTVGGHTGGVPSLGRKSLSTVATAELFRLNDNACLPDASAHTHAHTHTHTSPLMHGSWHAVAPLPTPRRLCAGAFLAGTVFVIGGLSGGQFRWRDFAERVDAYDPVVDCWYSAIPLSSCTPATSLAPDDSGATGSGGAWSDTPSLAGVSSYTAPQAVSLSELGCVVVTAGRNAVRLLDPRTNHWQRLPAPLLDFWPEHAAAGHGPLVYALGGSRGLWNFCADAQRLDLRAVRWEHLAGMPHARGHFAAVWLGGYVYALGGGMRWNQYASDRYCEATGAWEAAPFERYNRRGVCAVAV